jgi:hypothetical protein
LEKPSRRIVSTSKVPRCCISLDGRTGSWAEGGLPKVSDVPGTWARPWVKKEPADFWSVTGMGNTCCQS